MNIKPVQIKIKDIFNGYKDDGEDGVYAYGGKLTIRPAYQREFVYNVDQEKAVINTILNNYPLNIMYWAKTGDDTYEILDGQQRTLSIMHFLSHQYLVYFKNVEYYNDSLPDDLLKTLMDYELSIYICDGNESEKLEWFRVVNIAGEKLTEQELRNSVYTGSWLTDAKKRFSKNNCLAKQLSDKYIKAEYKKQELLEKALKGICEFKDIKSDNDNKDIISIYMALHRNDEDANELWQYFQDGINWIQKLFPTYSKEMQGLDWLHLYNKYGKKEYNTNKTDEEAIKLRSDYEVIKKSGIYEYILDNESPYRESYLNLRTFDENTKLQVYNQQKGICKLCNKHFELNEMHADHIIAWSQGGKTEISNCQMLCKDCNLHKSNK